MMETEIRKKSRIKLACDRCRARKRKCDGQEPICERCVKHGNNDCKYSHHLDKRRPFSNRYVKSLKDQIQGLESSLANTREKGIAENEIGKTVMVGTVNSFNKEEEIGISFQEHESLHGEMLLEKPQVSNKSTMVHINDLVDVHGKFKSENNRIYFYGPRSTLSFVKANIPLTTAGTELPPQLDQEIVSPSENDMLLCELYFAFQNVSFPFLSKKIFYEQLKLPTSMRNPNLISESLINAVLALGCIYDHTNKANQDDSNTYANKAVKLLQEEIAMPYLSTIQCCGLLAIFYISKNKDPLAWHYCGAAISSTYSLGLNMDNNLTKDHFISEVEAELRKMTFWAIYLLERALNNMLGRPTFLKTESINCMVPVGLGISDYETWSNPSSYYQVDTSEVIHARTFSLVTYTIELLITSARPLDNIYLSFRPSALSELEPIVNKADSELVQFESSLPEFLRLRFILSPSNRNIVSPGLYIFQLRYNNIHILLHRVFFIRDAERSHSDFKIFAHKKVCYHSANNISKLIYQYDNIFGLKNFDICSTDIICTAAIVFLYLFKHPLLEVANSKKMLEAKVIGNSCAKKYKKLKYYLSRVSDTNHWAIKNINVLNQLEIEWGVLGKL